MSEPDEPAPKRAGGQPGPHADAPDAYRCQRIVAMTTAGKVDLWRCGTRVRKAGGYCYRHIGIADARLEPLTTAGDADEGDG